MRMSYFSVDEFVYKQRDDEMCIQKETTKKKKNRKRAREEQREWRSRRRRLPSSDKKMTSSRTKKRDSAAEMKKQHQQQQNIPTTRWSTLVISRIFLPFFFFPCLFSSSRVTKCSRLLGKRIRENWNDKGPALFIGKVREPKITHTHSCLSIPTQSGYIVGSFSIISIAKARMRSLLWMYINISYGSSR